VDSYRYRIDESDNEYQKAHQELLKKYGFVTDHPSSDYYEGFYKPHRAEVDALYLIRDETYDKHFKRCIKDISELGDFYEDCNYISLRQH